MEITSLDQVTKKLQENLSKGLEIINQNAEQVKDLAKDLGKNLSLERVSESIQTVNNLAENALSKIAEQTNLFINGLTNATNTLEKSLKNYTKQIDHLNQTISQGIQASINSSLTRWIDNHPQLVWCLYHPLQTVGILLIILFLLSGLIAAASRVTERFWVFIISAPFKLVGFIWDLVLTNFNKNSEKLLNLTETETKVESVLNRLEANEQEHILLLRELRILLNSK